MNIQNSKLSTRLCLTVIVLMTLVAVLSWEASTQTKALYEQAELMYEHPLKTRRALGTFRANVTALQRDLRGLLLSTNSEHTTSLLLAQMDVSEDSAFRQLNVLEDCYLGPSSDITRLRELFVQSNSLREETTRLLQQGKLQDAITRTMPGGIGEAQNVHMNEIMDEIDEFSKNMANKIFKASNELHLEMDAQLNLYMVFSAFLLFLTAYVLIAWVRDPLKRLTDAADRFRNGDLKARSNYHFSNEFGVLASSFDAMADSVERQNYLMDKSEMIYSAIAHATDIRIFCRELLAILTEQTDSQIGAVYLLNSQGTAFEQFETLGLDAGCRTSFSAEEREGVFGSALATGHAQHITAIPSDTAFSFTTVSGSFRPLEIITLPVVGETQIAAVIYLASIRPYSQDNVRIVKHILATIAARLNGVLLFRKVQSLAERLNGQNRELEAQKQDLMTHDLEQTALNAELEVQSRELEKANRLKSVFLANMSHELRTPLNSVIALSGVLNRRLVNKIPTEEYNYLEVIEHNGQHLLSLINDILDLSRIEAGHEEIELRSFSIRELACGVVEMLEPLAWEKKIDLINRIGTDLPHLQSDSGKVRHILQNLAGNAVKFTQNGSVRLTAQQVGHDIEISVADSGIGIPPEELTRIFDEFHQVDNTATRSHGGTGLGLAIARKYAQLLGGDITVKSIFGHGSTFTLRLPIGGSASQPVADAPSNPTRTQESSSHPHRTQAVAHSAPPVHQAGTRILLVEDSEAIVIQMSEMLVEEGYKVRTAANGIEALARIEEELPDAVILDLMMPEMDGFAVLKAIRGMERTENLPVLILTARTVTREELGFLRHNHIYQLIRKGDVSRKDLLNAIAGILPQAVSRQPDQIHTHRCRVVSVPPKILVVEDNSDNMQTMRALLADSCTMIEANCGNAGVKQAHQYQPDLILMDIALPDMDGFETLTAIRKDPSLQDIPIIAVTARTMKGDREAILDRGFDGYVSKPVDPRLLKNAITEVLHGKE